MGIDASVRQWTIDNEERIVRLVRDLVGRNTVNRVTDGNENDCQHFLYGLMREMLRIR